MIIFLSITNGFHNIINSKFINNIPDVQIINYDKKNIFLYQDLLFNIEEISNIYHILECNAIIKHNKKYTISSIIGLENHINNTYNNYYTCYINDVLAKKLDINFNNQLINVIDIINSKNNINNFFILNKKSFFDENQFPHIYTNINFIVNNLDNFFSFKEKINIKLKNGYEITNFIQKLKNIINKNIIIYKYNKDIVKIMLYEKLMIYIIHFIMILISLNINLLSIFAMIHEKKNDIYILYSLGYKTKYICNIYIYIGIFTIIISNLIGTIISLLLLSLQKKYKILKIDSNIINYYPVYFNIKELLINNFVIILISILLIIIITNIYIKRIISKINIS